MAIIASAGFYVALAGAILLFVEASSASSDANVPEILKKNGLPEGLLPGTVKSYSLSENGKFEVQLRSSCTAKISTEEVYYKKTITGQLSYGAIKNLAGIQAHEFFWVSITGIEVDKNDPGIIWFQVGFISKSLDIELFRLPPTCNGLNEEENGAMTFPVWLSKALRGNLEVNVPNILSAGTARKMLQ